MKTESDFKEHLLRNLDTAEAALHYEFRALREMVKGLGAVGAAIHLLDLAKIGDEQKGFTLLAEAGLLHLSLEQAVLDFQESGLFPPSIIASARARLLIIRNKMNRKSQDIVGN